MFKVVVSVEMSTETFKECIEGAELLSAKINYDRFGSGKTPVVIHEDYFLKQAVRSYLEALQNEMKTENFN